MLDANMAVNKDDDVLNLVFFKRIKPTLKLIEKRLQETVFFVSNSGSIFHENISFDEIITDL